MISKTEVATFIRNQLLSRTEYYDLYSQLDDLSGGARIDNINVLDIEYNDRVRNRTVFFGSLIVEAVKEVGVMRSSFTGTFSGYFDDTGIELESASLDVST